MTGQSQPSDLRLFVDILQTLDAIAAPYVIIGAFAATAYGITRTTYDIDFIVDLSERHIQALVARYPGPRYYADPDQIRSFIKLGEETRDLWIAVKTAAHQEINRLSG